MKIPYIGTFSSTNKKVGLEAHYIENNYSKTSRYNFYNMISHSIITIQNFKY